MINLGFIGLGGMGMGQVRAFAKVSGCRIAAGADPAEAARVNFAKEFPQSDVYPDYRSLLKDASVDAVVVVTPTYHHRDVSIAAMKSGRHVLTEKPMARTVADCQKMIDVSEKTGKLLMVAHCRRFDSDWGCWGRIVSSGVIGRPVIFRNVSAGNFLFYSQSKWFLDDKLGGGPLFDGAIHNYDFGNYLFGDPQSVIASAIKLSPNSAVDTGTAVVHYKAGNQVMVSWSWAIPGQSAIDVLGSKGSITWGPGDLGSDKLDTKNFGFYRVANEFNQNKRLVKFKRTDMYVTQAKHFLDCIQGKAKCQAPATEAIKAVAVGEAILKAAVRGGVRKVAW